MSEIPVIEKVVPIPENVKVEVNGRIVSVIGPKGTLLKDFSHMPINITVKENSFLVTSYWPRKKEMEMVGTAVSHLKNMILGVTKGFVYKLKIVYAHFPITVKVLEKEGKILIENFTGERTPRVAKIIGNVKVKVKGDDIIVEGISLEDVSQTAANIEQATKIKEKDPRVFLDGIYVYEKSIGS
ncbi:MAG: 50S ribosomal protein L6 [Candidatus Bathyarchaeia archaeon]